MDLHFLFQQQLIYTIEMSNFIEPTNYLQLQVNQAIYHHSWVYEIGVPHRLDLVVLINQNSQELPYYWPPFQF